MYPHCSFLLCHVSTFPSGKTGPGSWEACLLPPLAKLVHRPPVAVRRTLRATARPGRFCPLLVPSNAGRRLASEPAVTQPAATPAPWRGVGLCPAAGSRSRSQTAATVGSRCLAGRSPWLLAAQRQQDGWRAAHLAGRPRPLSARPPVSTARANQNQMWPTARAAHGAWEGRLERKRRPRRREAARILRFVSRSPGSLRSSLRSLGSGPSHKKGAA